MTRNRPSDRAGAPLGRLLAAGHRLTLVLLPAVLTAACLGSGWEPKPPSPPSPGPAFYALSVQVYDQDELGLEGVTARIQDSINAGREAVTDADGALSWAALGKAGFTICLTRDDYRPTAYAVQVNGLEQSAGEGGNGCFPVTLVGSARLTVRFARQATIPVARVGQVQADRARLYDGSGDHLFAGTTLFWSPWGYAHDRPRLEQNLAEARKRGLDYVRVLGAVGPRGWTDRVIDPTAPDWPATVAGLTDLAYAHGLRVQWTIFGGIEKTPTKASRRAVVDRFLTALEGRHEKVILVEIANEYWQNGFPGSDGAAELRELAALVRTRFPGLVALGAPELADACVHQAAYVGSQATAVTLHYSRKSDTGEGKWRPVRQPWRESQFTCSGVAPTYFDNEAIGPQSSVAEDDDPTRLTMARGVAWLAKNGASLLHTGAGIRGGGVEDRARGRVANLWEVAHWDQTTAGIQALRGLLPATLPNWAVHNAHWASAPFQADDLEAFVRNYCATQGNDFVCLPIGITRPVRLTARRAMTVRVHEPLTATVLQEVTLTAGQALDLPASRPAAVLIGRWH